MSIQWKISGICKSILQPFSKSRKLQAAGIGGDAAKRHADMLKWQQESFHRILHLTALHNEGIVQESEVSRYRSQVLDTIAASPAWPESPAVIRDKLLFLKELLYANCISAADYHASKRPLLHRLAVLGVEIDSRDVIMGVPTTASPEKEHWSTIDLSSDKERTPAAAPANAEKTNKHKAPLKSLIVGAKSWKSKPRAPLITVDQNANSPSVLMTQSSPVVVLGKAEKAKRRPFAALFQKEQHQEGDGDESQQQSKSQEPSSVCRLVPVEKAAEDPAVKKMKTGTMRPVDLDSDMLADKVLGDRMKEELARIKSALSSADPKLYFSDEQVETMATSLPANKSDLKKFFPKAWCDRYGDEVVGIVRKEFDDHREEMVKRRMLQHDHRPFLERREGGDDATTISSSFTNPFWSAKDVM